MKVLPMKKPTHGKETVAQTTPGAPPARKVFIVDDHLVIRDGYTMAIVEEEDLRICGEAGDAEQALQLIPPAQPDVVLVDLSLPGKSGLDLIKDLKARLPHLPILVCSMHDDPNSALDALRAGASGYVTKTSRIGEVIKGIRSVLGGETWISDPLKTKVLDRVLAHKAGETKTPDIEEALTRREIEIFRLVGAGMTVRQIAKKLFVSVRTVECHRDHIRKKIGADNTVELQHRAFKWAARNESPPDIVA